MGLLVTEKRRGKEVTKKKFTIIRRSRAPFSVWESNPVFVQANPNRYSRHTYSVGDSRYAFDGMFVFYGTYPPVPDAT